jgi:hypothetical protein
MKKTKLNIFALLVITAFILSGYTSISRMNDNSILVLGFKFDQPGTHVALIPDPDPPKPPPPPDPPDRIESGKCV